MWITRRNLMLSTAAFAACPALAQQPPQPRFAYEDVIHRAEMLSRAGFDDQQDPEPAALAALDYDGYRKIRFRPDSRIKLGAGFELALSHRGHISPRRVGVNIARDGKGEPVPYRPAAFVFGGQNIGPFPANLG